MASDVDKRSPVLGGRVWGTSAAERELVFAAQASATRLVARTVSPGQEARSSATSGPASTTCSKLSSTSSARCPAKHGLAAVPAAASRRPPRARARAGRWCATRRGIGDAAPGRRRRRRRRWSATSPRRLPGRVCVLPMPGGPVRVTRRASPGRSSACTDATLASRPIRGVSGTAARSLRLAGDFGHGRGPRPRSTDASSASRSPSVQSERVGEEANGLAVGRAPRAAFEVADRPGRSDRPVRQAPPARVRPRFGGGGARRRTRRTAPLHVLLAPPRRATAIRVDLA